MYITFARGRTGSTPLSANLEPGPQDFIFALNMEQAPTEEGRIAFHDVFDVVPARDMFAIASAFIDDATDDQNTQTPSTDGASRSSNGTSPAKPSFKPTKKNNRKYYVKLHGWFMVCFQFLLQR